MSQNLIEKSRLTLYACLLIGLALEIGFVAGVCFLIARSFR